MNQTDGIRLEEFRQFEKETRRSTEYLIVGTDVAKDKHHAFLGTAMGKTLFGIFEPLHIIDYFLSEWDLSAHNTLRKNPQFLVESGISLSKFVPYCGTHFLIDRIRTP